jgi:hypothetical protein
LPSETQPTAGVRVNGILYDLATAANRNTWTVANSDRVLYGNLTSNGVSGVHATALALVTAATGKLTAANLSLLKRVAQNASPKIRPYTTKAPQHYVALPVPIRSAISRSTCDHQQGCPPRETMGRYGAQQPTVPRWRPDLRQVIALGAGNSNFVTTRGCPRQATRWRAPHPRVEPVFLCGQQAVAFAIGQMAAHVPARRDYGFIKGSVSRSPTASRRCSRSIQVRLQPEAMGHGYRLLQLGLRLIRKEHTQW